MNTLFNPNTSKWQLCIIQLTVVMSYLGLALPYSIFPLIFVAHHHTNHLVLYSFLLSSYPFGQFFGMPILGFLSDLYGRKWVLSYTLFGAMIFFIMAGYCVHLGWFHLLVIIRFFSGIFEGNASISLAMINDIQHVIGSKLKWFGKINIALTTGFLLGPFLGSFFSNHAFCQWFNFSTPFFVAALIYAATFILVYYFLIETNIAKDNSSGTLSFLQAIKLPVLNSYLYLTRSKLNTTLLLSLFVTSSTDIIYQFIPIYLTATWPVTAAILASGVFLLSAGKIIGSGYLLNWLFKFLKSEIKCLKACLIIFCGLLVCILLLNNIGIFLACLIFLGASISILINNSTALISNQAMPHEQGAVLGTSHSLRALGGAIICNLAALSCSISFNFPFVLSIGFAVLALLFSSGHLFRDILASNKVTVGNE